MRGRVVQTIDETQVARARPAPVRQGRPPRLWRALSAAAVVLCGLCLLGARDAAAQASTPVTNASGLTPLRSPNGQITLIPNAQGIERDRETYNLSRPWWVSYNDCLTDDAFTFTLSVTLTDAPLEIWAGTENCATNRSRTDRGQCWIVARKAQLSDTVDVRVPVRNVIARILNTTEPPENVSDAVCDDSTDPSGEAITFYFMLERGGQATEYFAWDATANGGVGFDVVGPSPPGNIRVGVGERQLSVRIDDIQEETDRERFEAFCVPRGTTNASLGVDDGTTTDTTDAGDVSLSTDSGLDAGGTIPIGSGTDAGEDAAPTECFTEVLRTGVRPPAQFSCGTASETSRTLNTSNLLNGTTYAVALAGQDNLGNAGVASDIKCGTPIPLDDFYELYNRSGGPGGGGFCSFSPVGQAPARYGVSGLLLVLAGLGLRRRRGAA